MLTAAIFFSMLTDVSEYELPQELPDDLRQNNKKKSQNWWQKQSSDLQDLIFGSSCQNLRKSRY